MASTGMQTVGEKVRPVYARPVPDFQALPSSIITAQLVQPTKVEYFPKDDVPQIDLKGHTVEELAAAANVSVDVIQSAIKVRQQQMMAEKKGPSKWRKPPTAQPSVATSSESTFIEKVTIMPHTTAFMSKKKATKKVIRNGHKVSSEFTLRGVHKSRISFDVYCFKIRL